MKHGPIQINEPVRANSDINITPLVDIVLVLLIIFMVVTPLLEKDILVRVPSVQTDPPDQVPPPDQIVVHVKGSGKLDINVREVEENDYIAELKKRLDPRQESERVVFFVAEEKVNYGRLVWAVDSAKMAGAQTIGIATDAVQ
ncbi:biopolymer transporter ExbD [Pendulispora rubella]|uniref:Biopolymer transporter ExbD n=1 Tax=Pendulispora rubella TaxID=2741070 RepID=A0ABZ2KZ09_9BACT